MTLDGELLRRYVDSNSEDAFAELVRRHLDLVYSAALRQVNGDVHLAQDVAQTVFSDLARKAAVLSQRQVLTGWLYTSTHFAAAKAVRTERRRHAHEQEAHAMYELLHAPAPEIDWERLRPVLDKIMHELKESDRDVILMRYFEKRQLADIGEALGVSEDTARKRVDRALEKLRPFVSKHGIGTAIALGTVLSSNAVQVAPAGMAAMLTSASLAGAAAGTGTTLTVLKVLTMTKFQAGIISAIVVAGVLTSLVMQHRAIARLREQNVSLGLQAGQMARLPAEQQRLSDALAKAKRSQSLPAEQMLELLKLRSEAGKQRIEVGKLRGELAARRSLTPSQASQESAATNYFAKESWATAGKATPEAALQSLNWELNQAVKSKDMKAFWSLIDPELRAEAAKYFAGKSEAEIASELASEFTLFEKTDGIRIVNKTTVSDDEVVMTYMAFYNNGVNDSWGSTRLKRSGGAWNPVFNP